MSKLSSRCHCSVSIFWVIVLMVSAVYGQEKNGEFKHELPEGVELVDPKSLGLTDADLSKFLGNVKVLGGGQVGDTKTQILTVGFEGDESINFNDFDIPGLTDGNNTLPQKDKEIADMAFQKFKEFFDDPRKANQFGESGKSADIPVHQKHEHIKNNGLDSQQKNPSQPIQHFQHQLQIPMIHKPYTVPNTQIPIHITTHQPLQRYVTAPPPLHGPPTPPPSRQSVVNFPSIQNNPPQNLFNAQINAQPPPVLEFGARIPVSISPQMRPPPESSPPPFQNQPINPNQYHPQQQQQVQRPVQQPHHHIVVQPQPQQPPQNSPPQVHFLQHPVQQHNHQFNQTPQRIVQPSHPPPARFPTRTPPPSPRVPMQNFNAYQPQPQQPPNSQAIQQPPSQSQGRIVRNQLLNLESNNQNFHINNLNHFHTITHPRPQQAYPSASNQITIQSPQPQSHSPATSHVYIHRGPKAAESIQHTSFHPSFQPPTRMAKDFTPMPYIATTTSKPDSFEVTPSMQLIPLSTNENAITDPGRMLQLRLYQKQQNQQKVQESNTEEIILPQSSSTPTTTAIPSTTTTPISITTSYPQTDNIQQDFGPSIAYQSLEHNHVNSNNEGSFSLQSQQQQHQLHVIQQQQQSTVETLVNQNGQAQQNHYPQFIQAHHPQSQTIFYNQEHRRPQRHGHRPRFQFHMTHEIGQPLKIQMNPDPKTLLNTIRRKRGYRRLSNLFNRMFRWDRH